MERRHGDTLDLKDQLERLAELSDSEQARAGDSDLDELDEALREGLLQIEATISEDELAALLQGAEQLADLHAAEGDYERAFSIFGLLKALPPRGIRTDAIAELLKQGGRLFRSRAFWDEALAIYAVALDIYSSLGNTEGMADIENSMAIANFEKGCWEECERHYLRAMELTADDNAAMRAKISNNLGALYNARGNIDKAISSYLRSIPDFQTSDNPLGLAQAHHNLGMSFAAKMDWKSAGGCYEKSLDISQGLDVDDLVALTYLNLAELYIHTEATAQAEEYCKMAVEILIELDDRLGLAEAYKILGGVEGSKGNWRGARFHFKRSIELNEECNSPLGLAEAYYEYGRMSKKMNRTEEAHRLLNQSLAIFEQLKASKDIESARSEVLKVERLYLEIIEALGSAVEDKDSYTQGHSSRVAFYSLRLVEALGLNQDEARGVVIAAYLHGVGKIYTPDEILNKPGKLTEKEFEKIKRHPEQGVASLKAVQFPRRVKQYILHHHERHDGSGYPGGLGGDEIPLGAQIIAMADFFDALTSTRSYRKAWSQDQALDIIVKNRDVLFSMRIVDCFLSLIEEKRIEAQPEKRYRMPELWKQCAKLDGGDIAAEQCYISL